MNQVVAYSSKHGWVFHHSRYKQRLSFDGKGDRLLKRTLDHMTPMNDDFRAILSAFFLLFPFSLLHCFSANATMPTKQSNSQRLSDICKPLSWFFPDLDEPSLQLLQKFNILNLLLVYCVPLFYIFYPALLLPAICFRSLSFLISKLWAKMSEANIIRDEDTAEYMGGDDMNFWLQRCSICLDSKFSLFLDSCRDQFCADCFAR
jgi:hypothetical protein